MRFTIFINCLFATALLLGQKSEKAYNFEFSTRAILLFETASVADDFDPITADFLDGAADAYLGTAFRLGVNRRIGEKSEFGIGLSARFTGFKTKPLEITDAAGNVTAEQTTKNKIVGIALPLSVRAQLSERLYVRPELLPMLVYYQKSTSTISNLITGESNTSSFDAEQFGVPFRDYNLGLRMGFGYYIKKEGATSVTIEAAIEYLALYALEAGTGYERRQFGPSVLLGIEL